MGTSRPLIVTWRSSAAAVAVLPTSSRAQAASAMEPWLRQQDRPQAHVRAEGGRRRRSGLQVDDAGSCAFTDDRRRPSTRTAASPI